MLWPSQLVAPETHLNYFPNHMNPDHIFRAVLVFWALLWFPVALFYRVRPLAWREKLDRRQEGLLGGSALSRATRSARGSWLPR